MVCAALSFFKPSFTFFVNSRSGIRRSKVSGCSLLTIRILVPSFIIAGTSGACSKPSTVRSITSSELDNAFTTGLIFCSAVLAPVERIGMLDVWGGVGMIKWKACAPRRWSASSLSWTFTGRDWVSDKMATTVPASTLQCSKTFAKILIHLPSMRSCNIAVPFCQSITFRL